MMTFLLAAVWTGCASKPSVSQDLLVDVPPQVVEQVRSMRADEQRLAERVAAAEGELATARDRESNQRERLNAQNDALKNDRRLKRLAVERADPDAARTTDEQVASREATVREIELEYQRSSLDRRRLEASLGVMRAERELTEAQIELAQARSVERDGNVRLDRFERAVVTAQGRLDAAKREQAYVDAEPTPRPLQNPAPRWEEPQAPPPEPEPAPQEDPIPQQDPIPQEDPGPQPLPPEGDTGPPPI